MPRVSVRPSGIEFEIDDGETVFEAAVRHGYRWPTICGGVGSCTTCYVVVVDGAEHSLPVSRFEAEGLTRIDLPPGTGDSGEVRLACQLAVVGDVVVVRSGVRPATKQVP